MARHGIHVSEILDVSIQSLDGLRKYQEAVHDMHRLELPRNYRTQATELIQFQIQAVRNLKQRSDANNQRLNNEITLVSARTDYSAQCKQN
jgi:hypothetical protein